MKLTKSIIVMFTMHFFCVTTNTVTLPPRIRSEKCSITFTPESPWRELGLKKNVPANTPEKPTLVAHIMLKKHNKAPLVLTSLKLSWHGPQIDHLFGSLYKKEPEKDFRPLQYNLICDGAWNKEEQSLMLNFDFKQKLNPTNIFCLVLNISPELKELLKIGYFMLDEDYLPDLFKSCAHAQKLFIRD